MPRIVPSLAAAGAMRKLAAAAAEIAAGERYRKVPYLDRGDATGALAQAIEQLRKALVSADGAIAEQEADREQQEQRRALLETFVSKFDRAAGEVQSAVAAAAGALRQASTSLTGQASVAAARSQSIERSAATVSREVATLAGAATELDRSLGALEGKSQHASGAIAGAVEKAGDADKSIHELGEAASRIGGMVELISAITDQTRMLALNATIEAARAGEAGRGFAVVANEVKNLVGRIEQATGEIDKRVEEIRGAVGGTTEAVAAIGAAMRDVDGLVTAIADAMKQQKSASQSISAAAGGAAAEAREADAAVHDVASAAEKTGIDARSVDTAAEGLAAQSDALQAAVKTFLRDLDHGAIRIGILHSLSGGSAVGERPLKDVLRMEVAALNARGGLLGRPVEALVYNPRSEPERYAELAERALAEDKVAALFGAWSSTSRKAVLPVLARHRGLLFYPSQYEGGEQDPNVVYCGAPPVQQLLPAIRYLMSRPGGGFARFFLVGSDTLYPQLTHRALRGFLAGEGVGADSIVERMLPVGADDWTAVAREIRRFAGAGDKPALVVSTIGGESNFHFFREMTGVSVPVLTVSIGEAEAALMNPAHLAGHMVAWNYLMAVDTPENRAFLSDWRGFIGKKDAVANDAMEASVLAFRLWSGAAEKAGDPSADAVRRALPGATTRSLTGFDVFIDRINRHLHKPALLGRLRRDGGIDILWRSSGLIAPEAAGATPAIAAE
jgi:urea transport system substrate-binding protein